MPLVELNSRGALQDFLKNNASCIVTFSAHWCGPCRNSRPALEQLANSNSHMPMAIIHEDALDGDLSAYNVRAFPTYVCFAMNGSKEVNRVEGANIDAVAAMIRAAPPASVGRVLGRASGTPAAAGIAAPIVRPPATVAVAAPPAATPTPMEIDSTEDSKPSAAAAATPEDFTANLDPVVLKTLTEDMGFSLLRAQKGLLYGTSADAGAPTVESAVEWITLHQEDSDIDETIISKTGPPAAQSYKCNECGKILSNMANLELHANKTGHSDFEESTESVTPLTEEEKAEKIAKIKQLLKEKRAEREAQEKVDHTEREKQRRNMGKEMAKTREQMEIESRKRATELAKKEKEAFKRERERIRLELAKDKAERQANKGKMASRLGVEGYHPDGIQYDLKDATAAPAAAGATAAEEQQQPKKPKVKADPSKIDSYIEKISSYKAGGDGGKCLKVLKAYVGNLVDNPDDAKFKSINMENKAFKTKVKPFVGGKHLLFAIGFQQVEGDANTLVLNEEDVDKQLLADTKAKLEKAIIAYG